MNIKEGGQLEQFGKSGQKLEEIIIIQTDTRHFELWLKSNKVDDAFPSESLSYLTVDEMLNLKDEITNALANLLK